MMGLWTWNEPGIFDVPPIGIFGWAGFAFLCTLLLEEGSRRNGMKWYDLLLPVVSVIGTHLLLLSTWWLLFRWISIPIAPWFVAGAAWSLSLFLVYTILRNRTGKRVERITLLKRLPAALLFFIWIYLHASESFLLVIYAIAFVPPYLTLMAQQYLDSLP